MAFVLEDEERTAFQNTVSMQRWILQKGWEELTDGNSGKVYYQRSYRYWHRNIATGDIRFDKPPVAGFLSDLLRICVHSWNPAQSVLLPSIGVKQPPYHSHSVWYRRSVPKSKEIVLGASLIPD